jgi:hypothetical protein
MMRTVARRLFFVLRMAEADLRRLLEGEDVSGRRIIGRGKKPHRTSSMLSMQALSIPLITLARTSDAAPPARPRSVRVFKTERDGPARSTSAFSSFKSTTSEKET